MKHKSMSDPKDLIEILKEIVALAKDLGPILGPIVLALLAYLKRFREWMIKFIPFLSLFIPNIALIWSLVYWVVENFNVRIISVFLSLVFVLAMIVSVYSYIWGIFIYPLVKSVPRRLINKTISNNNQNQEGNNS